MGLDLRFEAAPVAAICVSGYIAWMEWTIILHPDFDPEFDALEIVVRRELLALVSLLDGSVPNWGVRRSIRWKGPGTRT
ncbi:hypothetical protein [Niveispirillum sp. KHB5.9]|uniref:hypothetical protein n=1 Tax=Niveispirillum sp. KHB5.9 TaxID=3400269 RepID=UPI003A8864F9